MLSLNEIKKNDLIVQGILVSVSALNNGVLALISINEEVIHKRREIKKKMLEINEVVLSIEESFPSIYFETNRVNEIALLLNKNNMIFSDKFNQLNSQIYNKNHFQLFIDFLLNKKIDANEDVISQVLILGKICSEYNKIKSLTLK